MTEKILDRKLRMRALRSLEAKGLIESRLCPDGLRWFVTEKGERMGPDDVQIPDERLN
jgi:hypothetical protein